MAEFEKYKEKFLVAWDTLIKKSNEEEMAEMGRERIVVFVVALILALCLWLMVNLSRDYNLNVDLPISLGAVPEEQALAQDLPERATVSVSGEGWKLINLYNNPPSINVDVSDSEVNIYDQVQQQMNTLPNINVQKVQPLILTVQLEERVSKKVPLRSRVEVEFEDQYGFVGEPDLEPDSVTISGARSLVQGIEEWATDSVLISDISTNISRVIPLDSSGELISVSQREAIFKGRVSQFTEGQTTVNVSTRSASANQVVYSPSSITVKYDVPIDEYNEVQDINPFEAFVQYSQIEQDSSGFVTPQVIQSTGNEYHIKLRSFQPRRVAYFEQLD